MKKLVEFFAALLTIGIGSSYLISCRGNQTNSVDAGETFTKLSQYHIFKGDPTRLIPDTGFELYELSSELFTDYAEKTRFIKVPAGHTLNAINDGLPDFPNGTIIVKTFYYYNDKGDLSKGKRLIETRMLEKRNNSWQASVFFWNKEQTDAFLLAGGMTTDVSWFSERGVLNKIAYQVPSNKECRTCHGSNRKIVPIGFKLNNLNRKVIRNTREVNQLSYFKSLRMMTFNNAEDFSSLPNWNDTSVVLAQKARAYLEINCAHCHSDYGYCSDSKLRLDYSASLLNSAIESKSLRINKMMSSKRMPLLGTTVIHEEGLALIKNYIKSLN